MSVDYGFEKMRNQLLKNGVSPRIVERTIEELGDHLEDIQLEAAQRNISLSEAAERLGDPEIIARTLLARRELRSWPNRFPRLASYCMPLAYILLLPIAPIVAGASNRSLVARWGTALLLAAGITASMMLGMQLMITLA